MHSQQAEQLTIFGGFRREEVPVLTTEYSLISENQPLLLVVIIEAGIGVFFFSFEALYNVIEFLKAFFGFWRGSRS